MGDANHTTVHEDRIQYERGLLLQLFLRVVSSTELPRTRKNWSHFHGLAAADSGSISNAIS